MGDYYEEDKYYLIIRSTGLFNTVCVGSDGLQYCKVCGEAKEAFFPEGGFMGMKKHSRQCACDRKTYEEEQKYFKDKLFD